MRDHLQFRTTTGADGQYETLLASAEAERDRYQLLLDINNAVVTQLGLGSLLHATSDALRKVIPHDSAAITLYDPETEQLRLHSFDLRYTSDLEEGASFPLEGSPEGLAFTSRQPVVVTSLDLDKFPAPQVRHAYNDGLRSGCVIPLISHGRALGTLDVASRSENAFTEKAAELLTHIAGQIAIAVENALAYREISELKDKLAQEKLYLEEEIRSEMNFDQIVGDSLGLRRVLELVETVAPSNSTVLLLGETGTGKELVARAIHDHSRRKERTFVKLNCAAIPTGLFESELFGHEKGAFTGAISQKIGRLELAHEGTLFLDEVGDVPLEIQPKLLRALQEREFERLGSTRTKKVDVRLVAATNRDLESMIATREFRSDLYYRLNVFPIRIPPLRERCEDIPVLARYFAQKFAQQMEKQIETIPAATMRALTEWDWPGNVRELGNFIERAVILTRGRSLEVPLAELRRGGIDKSRQTAPSQDRQDIAQIVRETINALDGKKGVTDGYANKQREEIVRALTDCKGRVAGADGAATRLRINRTTLLSRMKKLGINAKQFS
ncbi:MAG: sigma 54-interacting transcriptional regulator [Pyrinomonadaceae bacterium]|nr:sigma 54-interacting transcriptional regulator [Pyrinomonadaceae bacterium]